MRTADIQLNPFSLMMDPAMVLQAMERSTQLRHLRRRKLRPLDKPLIPFSNTARAALDAANDLIDNTHEIDNDD